MSDVEWSPHPNEDDRRLASLLEDARTLQAAINDEQATADMLRRRGHPEAAQQLEQGIATSQEVVDLINRTVEEYQAGKEDGHDDA